MAWTAAVRVALITACVCFALWQGETGWPGGRLFGLWVELAAGSGGSGDDGTANVHATVDAPRGGGGDGTANVHATVEASHGAGGDGDEVDESGQGGGDEEEGDEEGDEEEEVDHSRTKAGKKGKGGKHRGRGRDDEDKEEKEVDHSDTKKGGGKHEEKEPSGGGGNVTAKGGAPLGGGGDRKKPDIRPTILMHVPRTGSGFEKVVVRHACGPKFPEGDPDTAAKAAPKPKEACIVDGKEVAWDSEHASTCRWNQICGNRSFARLANNAFTPLWPAKASGKPTFGVVKEVDDTWLPKVVLFAREPRQRLISTWYATDTGGTKGEQFKKRARSESACLTQMLLGIECGKVDKDGEPDLLGMSIDEAQRISRERLKQVGFVGLTEHWALSICLFHTMFGGDCDGASFSVVNRGPGERTEDTSYNPMDFGIMYYVAMDMDTYSTAAEMFWSNVWKYSIHNAHCRDLCPEAAAHFPPGR